MSKKALCMGINIYPGTTSNLAGCVNDANDWANTLDSRGFDVRLMTDSELSKTNMVASIKKLIEDADKGDSLVITYAGHGTFVPDQNGDEADNKDEGLCPYDIGSGQVLLDDEIHELFQQRASGSKIVMISDSCHSGSVIRMADPDEDSDGPRLRFLPPAVWMPEEQLPVSPRGTPLTNLPESRGWKSLWSAFSSGGGDLLMSGCMDHEFSYDASFRGRSSGAFTYYAHKALNRLHDGANYNDWHKAIRQNLPGSSYPQTPQITGSKASRRQEIFS